MDIGEVVWAITMAIWTLFVIYGTRWTYNYWTNRGMDDMVAVYYNRKIVHMLAAGVVLLIMPFVFTDPLIPLIGGFSLGGFTAFMHQNASSQNKCRRRPYWCSAPSTCYNL